MLKNEILTLFVMVLLASGCADTEQGKSTPSDETSLPPDAQESASNQIAVEATPTAKSVLAEIYKQPVADIANSQLSDGRYVGYWNGLQFSRDGKNYFVAFTEATPASEIEYPAPEDKVTIAQATYEFVNNQWQLKLVQQNVGVFGSNNRAPAVDTVKEAVFFHGVQGKTFIAIPSVVSANMGLQLFYSEIFAFSPESLKLTYLGSVKTGSDNSAGCSHEANSANKTKCASSTGQVQFSSIDNSSLPKLKVIRKGIEIDPKGNLIALSEKDLVVYHYDEKASGFVAIRQ